MENIIWPGWRVVCRIGNGSFGKVYEIERDADGLVEKAALKVISIPRDESDVNELRMRRTEEYISSYYTEYKDHVLKEYESMMKLRGCKYVVQCDGCKAIQHKDGIGWDIYIKMELLTPLQKRLMSEFPEKDTVKLGIDICRALVACSKEDIIHRDIKPQNIFLSEEGDYKLGDFGVARKLSETTRSATMGVGTHNYMAPEVKSKDHYSNKADICSLGIVLYMLLNERCLPFEPLPPELPKANEDYASHRFKGEPLPEPKNGSPYLKKIVLKACAYDPKERYQSAEEMLQDLTDISEGREPASFSARKDKGQGESGGYGTGEPSGEDGETDGPFGNPGTGTEGVFSPKEPEKPDPLTHKKSNKIGLQWQLFLIIVFVDILSFLIQGLVLLNIVIIFGGILLHVVLKIMLIKPRKGLQTVDEIISMSVFVTAVITLVWLLNWLLKYM